MIQTATYFFFGFLASFIGSLPIGPVNLSMVDTHIHSGNREAARFSLSASIVEVGQALIAIYFGAALFERIALQTIFNIFIVVLLIGLGLYYLQKKNTSTSRKNRFGSSGFVKGAIVGLINPQGIPFYMFLLALFHVDLAVLTGGHVLVFFLLGILLGKGGMLLLYGRFGWFLSKRIVVMVPKLNKFIGSILIILAFVSFVKDLIL